MDDHPDRFEGEEHKISVANLRRGLELLGYDVKEDGPFNDEVWFAFVPHLAKMISQRTKFDNTHIVEEGEKLGSIASENGLTSWKYLYECNKDAIGENPDLLEAGTELTIPKWDDTQGDEKIKAKGAKLFHYVHGMRYSYVWVPLSVSVFSGEQAELSAAERIEFESSENLTVEEFEKLLSAEEPEDEQEQEIEMMIGEDTTSPNLAELEDETELLITALDSEQVICRKTISKGTDIGLLIPDSQNFNVGIKGHPIEIDGKPHFHPDDTVEQRKEGSNG